MKASLIRQFKEFSLAAVVRANPGSLPDFIIVGAQKAGTSSLFATLTSHPMIGSSLRKEVHYFDLRVASHPLTWYKGHFTPLAFRRRGAISGEASPSYMFFPDCAEAIASVCPQARILIVLRDPVARAVSHYQHNRRLMPAVETEADASTAIFAETERVGSILADLARALPSERARAARFAYLTRGHYAEQIARFHAAFGMRNVMVLELEDLADEHCYVTADRLCDFLDVPRCPMSFERRNAGSGEKAIDPDLRLRLENYYAPHNAELAALLGRVPRWHKEIPV